MKHDLMLARIVADNDQDREACRKWMREATTEDKLRVWAAIQKVYRDPVSEIVSRFAQLAFAEMVAEMQSKESAQ